MSSIQSTKSFRRFSKNLFLVGRAYIERNKARDEVYSHLDRMRKSIIRMSLSYSDVDRLKVKISNLIDWERKYARFFKTEDKEVQELKNQVIGLEQELKLEREEKSRIISENDENIIHLADSLSNIRNQIRHLHLEKARREHRLNALEKKIRSGIDAHSYYHS